MLNSCMLGKGEGYKFNGIGISANHHWKGGGCQKRMKATQVRQKKIMLITREGLLNLK